LFGSTTNTVAAESGPTNALFEATHQPKEMPPPEGDGISFSKG